MAKQRGGSGARLVEEPGDASDRLVLLARERRRVHHLVVRVSAAGAAVVGVLRLHGKARIFDEVVVRVVRVARVLRVLARLSALALDGNLHRVRGGVHIAEERRWRGAALLSRLPSQLCRPESDLELARPRSRSV